MSLTQIQPELISEIPDGSVSTAKIADLNVTTAKIADANITAAKFVSGAISENNFGGARVLKFTYGNASPNQQPINNMITLSEAEAPIGSFVLMGIDVLSGSSAGDQYCYLYQEGGSSARIFHYVSDWYYYSGSMGLFYIGKAADRTFTTVHGTIAYSNNNDSRSVYYYGYLKVTK